MAAAPETSAKTIRLGPETGTTILLAGGGLVLGTALGLALPYIARWLASLPWAPWQGPANLINEWHNTWTGIALVVVGAIAGLLIGLILLEEMIEILVNRDTLTIRKKDRKTIFPRGDVSGIFFDHKNLVLTGTNRVEIHRMVPEDIPRSDLVQALVDNGWPFLEEDPFASEATPWVPHTRRLPEEANTILEARSRALAEDDRERANAFSRELGAHGYVVRDRDGQQYIAPIESALSE